MQGIDTINLFYFDINLYHLQTKVGYYTGSRKYCEMVKLHNLARENENKERHAFAQENRSSLREKTI